jgi:hypothetical protein
MPNADEPTLPDEEILRRLRLVRYSPASLRNARQAPSINGLVTATGLTREYLHRVANGSERLGPRSRQALSRALTDL